MLTRTLRVSRRLVGQNINADLPEKAFLAGNSADESDLDSLEISASKEKKKVLYAQYLQYLVSTGERRAKKMIIERTCPFLIRFHTMRRLAEAARAVARWPVQGHFPHTSES